MAHPIFEAGNPGRLPLPGLMTIFMAAIFALPAMMLVGTTWNLVPEHPWLPLVWIGAFFPLAVIHVLRRLMSRYALRVFDDGSVELTLPFSRVHMARADLARLQLRRVHAGGAIRRYWLDFGAADGRVLASLATGAFSNDQIERFVTTLRSVHPALEVRSPT